MPYLLCKKIENDVYNFPTWQYCKYKDIFDSRIIINSTAKFYISISYQKDLLSIDTRIFTPSIMACYFTQLFFYNIHLYILKPPPYTFADIADTIGTVSTIPSVPEIPFITSIPIEYIFTT